MKKEAEEGGWEEGWGRLYIILYTYDGFGLLETEVL